MSARTRWPRCAGMAGRLSCSPARAHLPSVRETKRARSLDRAPLMDFGWSGLVPRAARSRRTDLLEAGAAVHGLVATWLERNARLAAAVAACRDEELARATHATAAAVTTAAAATGRAATRRTARRATTRFVHETTGLVELLLSRGPNEFLTAVLAGQGLVRKTQCLPPLYLVLELSLGLGRKCLARGLAWTLVTALFGPLKRIRNRLL